MSFKTDENHWLWRYLAGACGSLSVIVVVACIVGAWWMAGVAAVAMLCLLVIPAKYYPDEEPI